MAGKRTNGSEAGFTDAVITDEPVTIGTDGAIESDTGDAGIPTVEADTIRYQPDDSEQPRRRGRKPGSRNINSKATKEATADLTLILLSVHGMLAAVTKVEELNIEESEAKKLGAAIQRVNDLYGGLVLPEKVAAWVNLALVGGQVYGPRAVTYTMRMKKEKEQGPVTIEGQQVRVN